MPNPYSDTELNTYQQQSQAPAGPAGYQQANRSAYGYASGDNTYANSRLGRWMADSPGGAATSSNWFTGANYLGENNGWDTTFIDKFISGQNEAAEQGTLGQYFSSDSATGIVTWDHKLEDGSQARFGDIFQDGELVGNIYKDAPDTETADLLLAPILFDGEQQARIFADSDRMGKLHSEIEDLHQQNNTEIPKALQAAEFQKDVEGQEENLDTGWFDTLVTVGAGALSGLATGATLGALGANPVTAIAGGVIGGVTGGAGAYLNQDELREQAARAIEITQLANEEEGTWAGISTGVEQAAGYSMGLIQPVKNVTHGLKDWSAGDVGDRESEFYRTDPMSGESETSTAWKVASIAATVADSGLQFGSGFGRALYMAQMSGVIGGEVSSLVATGGKVFDPREGGFDPIFSDDDGNFDPISGAAGILKIGIDAVQLGMVRGLAGQTRAAKEAAEQGIVPETVAGFKMIRNEAGEVVGKRPTLALLAPSEQVAWATASRQARVKALSEERAVSADDFYRAANNLANGSNRIKGAMVNAFGEGYEEFVQAALEPISMDGKLSLSEMANAFYYGAASGLGMSMGINGAGASQDQKMFAMAQVAHAIRFDGAELSKAEWDGLSPTEKRIRASLNQNDAEITKKALERVAKNQAATLIASPEDAAKAMDSQRAMLDKELEGATRRTDPYTQISGILDAGRVDRLGNPVGETIRAEAAIGSAMKVFNMLEERYRGLEIQQQFLKRREADYTSDASEHGQTKLAETRELLLQVERMMLVGKDVLADARQAMDVIYSPTSAPARVEGVIRSTNKYLSDVFDRRRAFTIEGLTEDQAADAGAQFVSLLHSREPKLDTGSYLALLPQISLTHTLERADNFLQINVDVLQAINGDFDGDKLRAEHQVVLSHERYLQTRAGQNFAGAGTEIDIAIRNFDEALTRAVGEGLAAPRTSQLRQNADAAMRQIEAAITHRYGHMMSPKAMHDILFDFRVATQGGLEEARSLLMNDLAREAGQQITDLGRAELRNEWLWIGKVVRSNFEQYQSSYLRLREQLSTGPTPTDAPVVKTEEGTNRRKQEATVEARTLSIWATGNSLFRKFQKIHYSSFNSRVLEATQTEPSDLFEMAQLYAMLSRNVTQAEMARAQATDTVAARVQVMLARLVDDAMSDPEIRRQINPSTAMSVFANMKVKNVWWEGGEAKTDNQNISLAQLLLGRALDQERDEFARVFLTDEKLQAKHSRLRQLTQPDGVNAEKAFIEVFKAVPFGYSLGGVTGALAPQTTPEQWLASYRSMDEVGRTEFERPFTNVPEYLSRPGHTNIPYSMDEMQRGEISAYRSMMDAMLAVGRSELTFDPSKQGADAFGGDLSQQSHRASDDFREAHALVRQALADFRTLTNRQRGDRKNAVLLVQEMLQAYPEFARQVLDLIPDAQANAVFEFRDKQLFIAPWIYEMFTMERADEALMHYWRNMTYSRMNSVLAKTRESDGKGVSGRKRKELNSRFDRTMYDLANEPGRYNLERVVRAMDEFTNLDEFFHWFNSEPGIRGDQPVLLPWNDDVAAFEADSLGAWTSANQSSELRQQFAAVRQGAEQLRDSLGYRLEQDATDLQTREAIRRAMDNDPSATSNDRELLRKFEKAVATSKKLPRGFGPAAFAALTHGAMRGFDPQSTDKGKTPTSYEAIGEFQALMDAFAFVPGTERVLEALTAHSISSLTTNVADIAKHGGTAMDHNGRQIEWEALTPQLALEMLENPAAAPLALTLLTPAALDLNPNGTLSDRLYFEASLTDLLDGSAYDDVFQRNENGALTLDRAYRYLMMVDSAARTKGGDFDVMKAVTDLAITRTSSYDHPARDEELARERDQAILDIATWLQMGAAIQSDPNYRATGVLEKMRKKAHKQLQSRAVTRRMPGLQGQEEIAELWAELIIDDLKNERTEQIKNAARLYTGADLDQRLEVINKIFEHNSLRVQNIVDDDLTKSTVQRFIVTGDAKTDQASRVRIVEFAEAQASFPSRAPESAEIWNKVVADRKQGTLPKLEKAEWQQLSESVMGVYLSDQLISVASHVSLPAFPKGDPATSNARFFKYFDPSFAYLADDLMDPDSPMMAGALEIQMLSDRPPAPADLDAAERLLNRTLLDDNLLGSWTPALMSQIVEAHERIGSSSGPPGIAMAGNGQKRWAAIAFATKRTAKIPDGGFAPYLTKAAFKGQDILEGVDPYNEIAVQLPNTVGVRAMPVAQLNNRFVSGVRINGVDVPLDYQNLGFRWDGETTDTGLRYVAVERLRMAVERWAATQNLDAADLDIEVDFLHPDSQPTGSEWYHSAYFEGMNHQLLPDASDSLIASFWSDNGGKIAEDTQWMIDSGKKGQRAVSSFIRPNAAAMAEADNAWEIAHDFSRMLQLKTKLVMTSDQGQGTLPAEQYNAVHKMVKLSHLVVGTKDGKPVVWTAEDVIAHQLEHGTTDPLPFDNAKLVKLSPDVLRTMMGETGNQGVSGFLDVDTVLNPDDVRPFQGITPEILERFGHGWTSDTGGVHETALAHVGHRRVLTVRTRRTDAEIAQRQDRILFLGETKNREHVDRRKEVLLDESKNSLASVIRLASGSIGTEREGYDFEAIGAPMIAPVNPIDVDHSNRLLQRFNTASTESQSFARGWQISDEGAQNWAEGKLVVETMTHDRPAGYRIVKDDLAWVALDSFDRPTADPRMITERLEKALRYLANSGATIVLGSGNGARDLRFESAMYLKSLGYVPVRGSKHMFEPAEFSAATQDERAYESTFLETGRITPGKQAITFLATDPIGTDENSAILNPSSQKLKDRVLVNNLLRSNRFQNYNIPFEDGRDNGVYANALTHLRSITDPKKPEYRKALLKMGGNDPARVMPLADALDRFHAKITRRASLLPEVGDEIEVGDIIPFVHVNGKIILYRHGMKTPDPDKLDELQAVEGMNVALAQTEEDGQATANKGKISQVDYRASFGRSLVLEVDLQPVGDKVQLEWNGMKYVLVPPNKSLDLPNMVFANGTPWDLASDLKSADSKEAFDGRVWNYRNALTFFSFDFLDDMAKFFFPGAATITPDMRVATETVLRRIQRQQDKRIPFSNAAALAQANIAVANLLGDIAADTSTGVNDTWLEALRTGTDATTQIARAMITYLLTPGADLDNVLRSGGFSHPNATGQVHTTRKVPGLFADLLDQGVNTPLHTEMIRRFDAQLARGSDGSGFRLLKDWTVEAWGPKRGNQKQTVTRGYLQFGEAHSTGDNPALDADSFSLGEKGAVSGHNVKATALSLGGITAHSPLVKTKAFARSFRKGGGVAKFATGDSVWEMLTAMPDTRNEDIAGWRRETRMEVARRIAAREEIVGFYQPLNTEDWTEEERLEAEQKKLQILNRLNLFGKQTVMVDTWVRQHLGRPHTIDENGNDPSKMSHDDVMQVLTDIEKNINTRLLPTAGAMVPLMDVNHLTAIYMANLHLDNGWAPRDSTAKNSPNVASWNGWVEAAFGHAWDRDPQFDLIYLLAIDGFMHGYQGATSQTRYLPVSSDILRQRQLMDPANDSMIGEYTETRRKVSISEDENILATDEILFNSERAGLDELVIGYRIYDQYRDNYDPNSAKGKQQKRIARWRKETDTPHQVGKRIRGVRAPGQTFLGHTTNTSAFWRIIINWRAAKTLINPGLIVMAPVEAFYRREINLFANALTGEGSGAVGRVQARWSDRLQATRIGDVAAKMGLKTTYTHSELREMNDLVATLSSRKEFKSTIYQELMFQYPSIPGIGRVEKGLERLAKLGGRLQDPAYGMLPRDLSRIYIEAVMTRMAADPTGGNIYSPARLIREMTRDPNWVMDNDKETHDFAIARIANMRSTKPTPMSLMLRGVIEPMSQNPSFAMNSAGNFLKTIALFQNYWANFSVNLMGLQGASDFLAFMVDGREKKFGKMIQRTIGGKEYQTGDHYDMTEVLESLDLADSFIRGGVTHSALFALGMMSGGLGLSGEDEEEKWRRRAAELQGAGFIRDPRKLQADYRNKDALYLDWLPLGMDSWFRVPDGEGGSRSVMQMNWLTRTIFSPIIGMERFFNTGDFTEVIHGFSDAIGSHPIANVPLWNDRLNTVAELQAQAARESAEGGPEGAPIAASKLMTAIGLLDSMLIESSFINMIYVGHDRYDRDPRTMQRLDSDGNPQVDVFGNPTATDALRQYKDPVTGEIQEGFIDRDANGAAIRSLTESRFGLALVGSLFSGLTGGDFSGDLWRENMVVKTQSFELQPSDRDLIEAYLAAAFVGTGGQVALTESEAYKIELQKAFAGDEFIPPEDLEKLARIRAAAAGQAGMSIINDVNREVLTDAGAKAVFEGLWNGYTDLGDAALNGIYIPQAQREKIQVEWMTKLTNEGIALGLDKASAIKRTERIWFGAFPQDQKEAGRGALVDLVFNYEDIPASDTLKYNQLNTTYVTGPDGYPKATGFQRSGFWTSLGLAPGNRAWLSADTGLAMDARLNTVDNVVGINTGMRALEARGEHWEIPSTEDEIRAAAEKILDAIKDINFPQKPYPDKDDSSSGWQNFGSGWRNFGGYGGFSYGGGGGGGGGSAYFTRMNPLPTSMTPYANSTPFINTSNPIIRRANIRRERSWSERGRLKQWQ